MGLLLAAFSLPFVARALGTGIGAFSMFTHLEQYHLDVSVRTASGEEPLPLATLAPHLSQDARQVILPAAGHGFGEEQIDDLTSGLPEIGALVCALQPTASSARARLSRGPLHGIDRVSADVTVRCSRGK